MSTLDREISKEFSGTIIKLFLKENMGLSSRLVRSASREKRILVNNRPVNMDYVLKEKDLIKINLAREESQNITPEKMDLDIVYEDSDIIVINKNPFMVVHPTIRHNSGTLANGLLYYFKETNQNCIVRLVSRLDMDTSGLIIVAKNQFTHMRLSKDMEANKVKKRYLALVHGNLEKKEGTIDLPIYRPEVKGNIIRVIDERGQKSITHYKVVTSYKNADLVECILETGRTHQIRVHLKALGHPIYGDSVYGEQEDINLINRQALHAYGLEFESPRTKQKLSLLSELPDDIKKLIDKIQS